MKPLGFPDAVATLGCRFMRAAGFGLPFRFGLGLPFRFGLSLALGLGLCPLGCPLGRHGWTEDSGWGEDSGQWTLSSNG